MRKLKIAAAMAVGLLSQTPSFAGAYYGTTVVVGSIYGYGSLVAARDSGDSKQAIGCYIGAYVTNVTDTVANNYLSCSATDAAGNSYYCYDYTPPDTWIKMVAALNSTSWIYFYGDSSHHCQGLNTQQGSAYL